MAFGADARGEDLGDVDPDDGALGYGEEDGAEHGGSADADAADEAGDHESVPVPGEGAADGGEGVQDGHDAKGFAAANLLAEDAGGQGAEDGSGETDGDGEAEGPGGEVEDAGELLGGAGDDGGVEAEEQAAERAYDGGLRKISVQRDTPARTDDWIVHIRASCSCEPVL